MFDNVRRLHLRGQGSLGITVDAKGAMLGPDCVLVRRMPQGYLCISHEEAAALQDFLFGDGREPDWLFGQCRRIAKALDNREIVLAQIFGLQILIEDLDRERLVRLARAAPFIKADFNPGEARTPKGDPDGGERTTGVGDFEKGSVGELNCEGFSGGCQSGGTYGTSAMYRILGRNLCRDCAVKTLGLENESGAEKSRALEPYLIGR